MNRYELSLPVSEEMLSLLRAGDRVYLSGCLYTARDAAHKRIAEAIREGRELPFPLKGETVYYAGPAPARPGHVSGPCGPTTSGRMDPYTPLLLENGLKVMIGKGERSSEVKEVIRRFGCVYLGVTGGAAALTARCITESRVIAYDDLGAEAVRRYTVCRMPAIVLYDRFGGDLYTEGRNAYRAE